jgi:NADPH:quinone reductase-like Zn-dependent oxidoreductase
MRAVKIGAPGGLDRVHVVEVEDPGPPRAGEIRVRIHASSLNYHDMSVVKGIIPSADGRIPMADGAGVVEAVGAGVEEFAEGDHVVSCFFPDWQAGEPQFADFSRVPGDGMDGYAVETVVRPATWFTHAPEGWSHGEAATITTAGLTAWRLLVVEGGLKAGDAVLALGTGGVSIYALQIAKAMSAEVIVTSSSNDKLERARGLGADECINYRETPKWGDAVRKRTGGRGVDQVIEVGGPGTLAQSIKAARVGGHIGLVGVLTGIAGDVPTAALMRRQQKLQGVLVGSREHQLDFVRALEAMKIRPVIDRTFPLEQIADAFRYEESGRHFGKICLEF